MKTWHLIGLAAVVAVLVAVGLIRKNQQSIPPAEPPPEQAKEVLIVAPGLERPTSIVIASPGAEEVILKKTDTGWIIPSLFNAPADDAKVRTFVNDLLAAKGDLHGDNTSLLEQFGLDDAHGIRITLEGEGGTKAVAILGNRPEGPGDANFIRPDGDARSYMTQTDLRGQMGLWGNDAQTPPDSRQWLRIEATEVDIPNLQEIEATYPDHQFSLSRRDGKWVVSSGGPAKGTLREDEMAAWLKDISTIVVANAVDPDTGTAAGVDAPTNVLRLKFADGKEMTLSAVAKAGEKSYATISSLPGLTFQLADWRFAQYFRPGGMLFDLPIPKVDKDKVLFIDLRYDNDNVRIARRGNEWRAIDLNIPLNGEAIDSWVDAIASLKAQDYADAGKVDRPPEEFPVMEVRQADGSVTRYRRGLPYRCGKSRYLYVENDTLVTVSDREASAIFPAFAELFAFEPVAKGIARATIDSVTIEGALPAISLKRGGPYEWLVTKDGSTRPAVDGKYVNDLLADMLLWTGRDLYTGDDGFFADAGSTTMAINHSGGNNVLHLGPATPLGMPARLDGGDGVWIDESSVRSFLAALDNLAVVDPAPLSTAPMADTPNAEASAIPEESATPPAEAPREEGRTVAEEPTTPPAEATKDEASTVAEEPATTAESTPKEEASTAAEELVAPAADNPGKNADAVTEEPANEKAPADSGQSLEAPSKPPAGI